MATTQPISLAIGVDIGGTTIKSGIVDSSGKLLFEQAVETPTRGAEDMARVIARELLNFPSDFHALRQLGVGVPGAMDSARRIVNYPPNLKNWGSEPFYDYLSRALPDFTIALDNDAKTAALAEAKLGEGRGQTNFLLATLGTGVGGGLFLNGAVFRGDGGGAGEFGHLSVDMNGRPCACGARGCIETYLGSGYLVHYALEALPKSESALKEFLRTPAKLTPLILSEAARSGDEFAQGIFQEAGRALGFAFASVAKLLDLRTFILAGGISDSFDLIVESALPTLRNQVLTNQRDSVRILRSSLGTKSGIIGAAMLCFE